MKKKQFELLNDGAYRGLEDVEFPVKVKGHYYEKQPNIVMVTSSELVRIGADLTIYSETKEPYVFFIGSEIREVV